jgi:hypothetical protein
MAAQPFDHLLEGDPSLLRRVELVVVDAHRRWSESRGRRDWSEPQAYQWLHYEDADPVARLAEGLRRLGNEVELPPDADASALKMAFDLGYTERG